MSHAEQDPNLQDTTSEGVPVTQEDLDTSKESFNLLSEEQQRLLSKLEEARLAFIELAKEYQDASFSDAERAQHAEKMTKYVAIMCAAVSGLGVLAAFRSTLLHPVLNLAMIFLPPAIADFYHKIYGGDRIYDETDEVLAGKSIEMAYSRANMITDTQREEYIKALMRHGAVYFNPESGDEISLSAELRYVGKDGEIYDEIPKGYILNTPDNIIDKLREEGDVEDFKAPQVTRDDVEQARQTLVDMWKGKHLVAYKKGLEPAKYYIAENHNLTN